ncbi:hypothetical protein JCM24511_04535 [Saitozyma sp. JCM 24511]|nr:hypothetical protein JCM24511_04535 [Saitozyma sp. JCM 24511]
MSPPLDWPAGLLEDLRGRFDQNAEWNKGDNNRSLERVVKGYLPNNERSETVKAWVRASAQKMASWRHEAARKAVRQGLQRPPKIVHRPNHDPEQLTPAQTQTAVNLLHQLLSHKPDGVFTLDKAERREIASSVGKLKRNRKYKTSEQGGNDDKAYNIPKCVHNLINNETRRVEVGYERRGAGLNTKEVDPARFVWDVCRFRNGPLKAETGRYGGFKDQSYQKAKDTDVVAHCDGFIQRFLVDDMMIPREFIMHEVRMNRLHIERGGTLWGGWPLSKAIKWILEFCLPANTDFRDIRRRWYLETAEFDPEKMTNRERKRASRMSVKTQDEVSAMIQDCRLTFDEDEGNNIEEVIPVWAEFMGFQDNAEALRWIAHPQAPEGHSYLAQRMLLIVLVGFSTSRFKLPGTLVTESEVVEGRGFTALIWENLQNFARASFEGPSLAMAFKTNGSMRLRLVQAFNELEGSNYNGEEMADAIVDGWPYCSPDDGEAHRILKKWTKFANLYDVKKDVTYFKSAVLEYCDWVVGGYIEMRGVQARKMYQIIDQFGAIFWEEGKRRKHLSALLDILRAHRITLSMSQLQIRLNKPRLPKQRYEAKDCFEDWGARFTQLRCHDPARRPLDRFRDLFILQDPYSSPKPALEALGERVACRLALQVALGEAMDLQKTWDEEQQHPGCSPSPSVLRDVAELGLEEEDMLDDY